MKEILVKNIDVFKIFNFLKNIDAMPAKQSRARTKLVNSLDVLGKEYIESQKQVVNELGGSVDENLKIVFDKDNIEAKLHVDRNLLELANEEVSVREVFVDQFKTLKEFFDNWNGDVSNLDAVGYDVLVDLLDNL